MSQTPDLVNALDNAASLARRPTARPDAVARRACLAGRSIAFVRANAPVLRQASDRSFMQRDERLETTATDLFLVDHPLPLAPTAVRQRGACTVATGLSAPSILSIQPPSGYHALSLVTYVPTGKLRPDDAASTAQWRECGYFNVQSSPDELLHEALASLGLQRTGSSDAGRGRIKACLQSEAEAASQLFTLLPWLHVIKHRLPLRGLDRPCLVATVPETLATHAYTEVYGADLRVAYSRDSAGATNWRH